jgi:hypothetical protein
VIEATQVSRWTWVAIDGGWVEITTTRADLKEAWAEARDHLTSQGVVVDKSKSHWQKEGDKSVITLPIG